MTRFLAGGAFFLALHTFAGPWVAILVAWVLYTLCVFEFARAQHLRVRDREMARYRAAELGVSRGTSR